MSDDKKITELLGVDSQVLSDNCAAASRWLMESKLFGGKTQEEFIALMEEKFTPQEMKFLAIGFITQKTDDILKNLPGLGKFIDEAILKNGLNPEIAESVKEALGLKTKV